VFSKGGGVGDRTAPRQAAQNMGSKTRAEVSQRVKFPQAGVVA